jgi:hypothetical protein
MAAAGSCAGLSTGWLAIASKPKIAITVRLIATRLSVLAEAARDGN